MQHMAQKRFPKKTGQTYARHNRPSSAVPDRLPHTRPLSYKQSILSQTGIGDFSDAGRRDFTN
ncbi:MAG: hypothetical protein ACYS76_03395 [Planctomycetota bacterium]|jgi:hypothetical protein